MAVGTTPTSSPEIPEIKDLKELRAKNTDVLGHLEKIPLKPEEKTLLKEEYEKSLLKLEEDHKGEKEKAIPDIKGKIEKLKTSLQKGKEEKDVVKETDSTKHELIIGEIQTSLAEFKKDLEEGLKPTEKSEGETTKEEKKPETPAEKAIAESTKQAQQFFSPGEGDEIKVAPTVKVGWGQYLGNMIRGWIVSIKEALHMNVTEDKARLEGYSSYEMQQKSTTLLEALTPYMGKAVESLRDPKESPKTNEESLVRLIENAGIIAPEDQNKNYTRPCIKYIFTGDESVLKKLPESKKEKVMAMRGKFLEISQDNGTLSEKTTREKIEAIFTIDSEKIGGYALLAGTNRSSESTKAPDATAEHSNNVEIADKKSADKNLAEAEAELLTIQGLSDDAPEKQDKLIAAEKKVSEAKKVVEKIIDDVKKKIDEAAKKAEAELKKAEAELMLTNNQKSEAERVLNEDPSNPDLQERVKNATEIVRKSENNRLTKERIKTGLDIENNKIQSLPPTTAQEASEIAERVEKIIPQEEEIGRIRLARKDPEKMDQVKSEIFAVAGQFKRSKIDIGNVHEKKYQEIDTNEVLSKGKKTLEKYKNNNEIKTTNEYRDLQQVVEHAELKIDFVIMAINKKIEMGGKNKKIKWNNVEDENPKGGWVSVDGDRLDFDVDWSAIDETFIHESPIITKLGGLIIAREILIANKKIVEDTTDTTKLKGQ